MAAAVFCAYDDIMTAILTSNHAAVEISQIPAEARRVRYEDTAANNLLPMVTFLRWLLITKLGNSR